jgi:hypothetical protein
MAHKGFCSISTIDHPKVKTWERETIKILRSEWRVSDAEAIVEKALDFTIGLANRQRESSGKDLPLDQFYTLYSFSNLDKLAFEIEEALLPHVPTEHGRINRHRGDVRRHDLIVEAA